jgi:hypothetical protein
VTDVNNAGTVREVLLTTAPTANVAGVVREVLVNPTAAPPPPPGGQSAVTINTG